MDAVGGRDRRDGAEHRQPAALGHVRGDRDGRLRRRSRRRIARWPASRRRVTACCRCRSRRRARHRPATGGAGRAAAKRPPGRRAAADLERRRGAVHEGHRVRLAGRVAAPHHQVAHLMADRHGRAAADLDLLVGVGGGGEARRRDRDAILIDRLGAVGPRDDEVVADPELDRGGPGEGLALAARPVGRDGQGVGRRVIDREPGAAADVGPPADDRGAGRQRAGRHRVGVDLDLERERGGRLAPEEPNGRRRVAEQQRPAQLERADRGDVTARLAVAPVLVSVTTSVPVALPTVMRGGREGVRHDA